MASALCCCRSTCHSTSLGVKVAPRRGSSVTLVSDPRRGRAAAARATVKQPTSPARFRIAKRGGVKLRPALTAAPPATSQRPAAPLSWIEPDRDAAAFRTVLLVQPRSEGRLQRLVRDIAARSHHPARPRLTATAFAFTLGRSITLRIPTRAGLQPANREDDCQDAVILRHRSATPVQLRACSQDARGSARSAASAQPRRSGDPQTPGVTIRASFASWVHVGRYDHRRRPSLGIAWLRCYGPRGRSPA